MTDLSQFVAEAEPVASQFNASLDLRRVDRNIQQIDAVEQTWSLPRLPDEVKADLATLPDVDETGLFAFLTGIEDEARRAREDEGRDAASVAGVEPIPNRGIDQARIVVASLSGNPAPTALAEDAVKRFKLEAINAGLLDMRPEEVDSTWSPEFNRIRNDLAFQRYDERLRGDREGAMPLEGVNKLLFDFTSPTGLLAAATRLDLWWDKDDITSEWRSWGDKWRALGEAKDPLDWGAKLWDALTGPLDDVLLPAINLGLMFAGVGAAMNTGRIGLLLASGRGIDAIGDIYRTSKLARFTGGQSALRNFGELGRASGMATRLSGWDSALARATGETMKAWRRALPVRVGKGLLQPGMRLGVVSQLESRMGSFQGGVSLADVSDPIQELSEQLYMAGQSPVTVLPEVMIAPYNIFVPGSFVKRAGEGADVLGRVGRGARLALGSAPGRATVGATAGAAVGTATGEDVGDIAEAAVIGAGAAAVAPRVGSILMKDNVPGAIKAAAAAAGAGVLLGDEPEHALWGAAAGVGLFGVSPTVRRLMTERLPSVTRGIRGVGRGLDLLSFRPAAANQEAALAIHVGMVSHLETAIASAASAEEAAAARQRLNRWNSNARLGGVTRALVDEMELATGNEVAEEVAAASVVWANTLLAIDHIASTQAKAVKAGGWRTRFASARNKLANQIRPFDLTQASEATLDDLATAIAWTQVSPRQLSDGGMALSVSPRDLRATADSIRERLAADPVWAEKMVRDHRGKAIETLHQLWNPDNFPKPDVNAPFGGGTEAVVSGAESLSGIGIQGRAALMQQYMPQIWDRFGNFPRFVSATDSIRKARASGLLDPAELVPALTRTGRPSKITDVRRRTRNRPVEEANEALTEAALRPRGDTAMPTAATPLAPGVLPGRITVELLRTKTSQELFELREEVVDFLDARRHLDRLEQYGWESEVAKFAPETPLAELDRAQIAQLIKQLPGGGATQEAIKYVTAFAKRKGATFDDLAVIIRDEASRIADDVKTWDEYGLPIQVADENGRTLQGFEALQRRAADLEEAWKWAAKEVDTAGLAKRYRDNGMFREATEVESLDAALRTDGYRLVHGTEFVMPEDLALVPNSIWSDVSRKHLNYATLGNFFRGRLPAEGHIVADLRHRAALVRELSELKDSPLNKATVRSEEVDGILDFLQRWLRTEQDQVEHITRHADLGSRTRRTGQRLLTSMTPVNVEDLQMRGKEIRRALRAEGFTDDEARAITRATAKFRNSSFRDMGLYAFEAKARSGNQAAWALKMLSGANYGEKFLQRGRLHRFAGTFVGAAAGRSAFEEDDDFETRLGKVALGAAAGAAVGTVTPQIGRALGADILAAKARDWRYGYMADIFARARDSLRFTISPIFDASRYTEGFLLGHTGAPLRHAKDVVVDGKVVAKAGDRLVLPGNLSPRALKRRLSKTHGPDRGREVYEARIGQFQKFARDRQDFDPEVLDSAGRWFKQVGILGFSPVDWMGTMFAHLVDQGLDAGEAYDGARRAYTYATGKGIGRSRSPAELSVNFVMFPFSFQKKALGALGKWMNDDLGRSIIIHDALKTYELLDEEYDLESRWRNYFPWINQLKRLNLFAYGLSAGRFGGINSQLFESGGKMAWNMFVPAGLKIESSNAEEIQALTRNLLPVLNDINWMVHNFHEQANSISSPSHMTIAGERSKGWQEWNDFKSSFNDELRTRGYTLEDIHSKPWLAEALAYYEDKRTELAEKYPAWWSSRSEAIGNNIAEEQARNLMVDRFAADVRAGAQPNVDDAMIAQFEEMLTQVKQQLSLTMGIDSLEDAPPAVFDQILSQSVENARLNPRWRALWDLYYLKALGPITVEQRL